jgi:hypothetical protein
MVACHNVAMSGMILLELPVKGQWIFLYFGCGDVTVLVL